MVSCFWLMMDLKNSPVLSPPPPFDGILEARFRVTHRLMWFDLGFRIWFRTSAGSVVGFRRPGVLREDRDPLGVGDRVKEEEREGNWQPSVVSLIPRRSGCPAVEISGGVCCEYGPERRRLFR